MTPRPRSLRMLFVLCLAWPGVATADEAAPSPRRTETVALIERCLPSVVSILTEVDDGKGGVEGRVGSGSVIHESGFVLTNEHVIRGARNGAVMLSEGVLVPMRLVAAFPHDDLAILKLKVDQPLPPIQLGRSHDVLLGEPTLVIGSPGGLVHSVSTGIVSGINRSTRNESNFLPWMIQTNAAVNRGNSGGPLINALGEQIGVMATIGNDLQNVSFAIAIDHVRKVLPQLLSVEQRCNFWLGADCDPLADGAVIQSVEPESPAAQAGLQAGDRLRHVGKVNLHNGIDLQLALLPHGPGDSVTFDYTRDGREASCQVSLGTLKLADPTPAEGLEPGLQFAIYHGDWSELPDVSKLQPDRSGHCTKIDPAAINAPVEHVAIEYTGFIEAPADDLYAFYTTSDDGSRLWIDDRLVVDNDGLHPARETGGLIRLRKGLHRLRVSYFERGGAEFLSVSWDSPRMKKAVVAESVLFAPSPGGPAESAESQPALPPESKDDAN
jgi:S1-C subfamily serine protease